MADHLTVKQRIFNRLYALPAVAQWWARRNAARSAALVNTVGGIPFALPIRPLAAGKLALVTTAGVHLDNQPPFDMQNPDGDASYREIPTNIAPQRIVITHDYYDHRDADADLNVVFPLAHFHDLQQRQVIGALAPRHFGLMGHIEGEQASQLIQRSAPEIAAKLAADGVDFAFLTPA